MKKIIHFSDLHIGYKDMGERLESIIENMVFVKQPAFNYVVVVTGDIVHKATDPANYEEAAMYLGKIQDEGYTVLMVPGNHDYGAGSMGSKKYVDKFKETFFGTTNIRYPKLDFIGKTAFIGLDSMAEELHWHDNLWANGELGKKQLERLKEMLASKDVTDCEHRVVYLHHHPFDPLRATHKLKDAKKLQAILKENGKVDALLYGHNHQGKKRNGVLGIPRCYDAGSSTRKDDAAGEHRVIDLSRDARYDYDADFHGPHSGLL